MAERTLTVLSRSQVAVLDAVRARRQATRADVAAAVDLSTAMTARVVASLQEAGLIREAGWCDVAGPGRHALLLELQPNAAYVIGADIGTQLIHLLVSDLQGEPHVYCEMPSDLLAGQSQPEIAATLAGLIRDVVSDARIPLHAVAAAGVSVTGIIDSGHARCLFRSNTPGWNDFPIGALLGAALRVPVILEEAARAKSVAELHLGAAQGAACPGGSFLYVDAGASIGASLVINGRPFSGVHGLAGELGHVTVEPGGDLCRCGNHGCLQATGSVYAILARARDLLRRGVFSSLSEKGESLTLPDLAAAAAAGDKLALGLLTDAGERLGVAISMALNLLGVDLVVLGGALVHCSPLVLEAAQRMVRLHVLPMLPATRTVVRSSLGNDAAARGVSLQAIDWLFAAPSERLLGRTARGDDRTARPSPIPSGSIHAHALDRRIAESKEYA
jgi:predicted NBD/HSP70 family sugar kinase